VKPVYVDLYGTTSAEDFISVFLRGVSPLEPKIDRLSKIIREKITSLTVNFSFDPITGLPVATPVFNRRDQGPAVDEIFGLIETLSKKKKIVVAFDEFQEVGKYGGDAFEKHLRKSIQRHRDISYVFAGSQRHLITEMFNDAKRAFYMLAVSYPLSRIETEDYVKWVQSLYRKDRRTIAKKYIEAVVARCENHPMYVQQFFFHLWNEPECSIEVIDRVESEVVENRTAEFSFAWDSFSLNQKKTLKLIAATGGKNVFSAENLSRFNFRTASQVSVALGALEKREFVVKNAEYHIQDPLFRRWIGSVS
jgi:hypothetical protein